MIKQENQSIKMEDEDVKIKPEMIDSGDIGNIHIDEDDYEDTGELQIRGDQESEKAWLAKLPKWLWEAWSNIAEEDEVELGKIRVYNSVGSNGKQRISIFLKDIPGHSTVPKKYDITMNKERYNNTVVFSEKDQPGFRGHKPYSSSAMHNRQRDSRYDNNSNKISKRPYRSSIPKQTSLAGYLQHEVTVTAVENAEYQALTSARFEALSKPKNNTIFTKGVDYNLHPGQTSSQQAFGSFMNRQQAQSSLTDSSGRKKVAKSQKNLNKGLDKAVRVSQEQLLDMLHACFGEYRYWSLLSLRQKLHQPEAFIKNVLEKIGVLDRSGPFQGKWRLRDEYLSTVNAAVINRDSVKEEAAIEQEEDLDEEDDDMEDEEDDTEQFEDVQMED